MLARFPAAIQRDRLLLVPIVALLVEAVLVVAIASSSPERTVNGVVGWLATAAGTGLLPLRFRWPVTIAVLSLALTMGYYVLSTLDGPAGLTVLIVSLYSVARGGRLAAAVAVAVFAMLVITWGEVLAGEEERHVDNMSMVLFGGWFLSLIMLGHAVQLRHAHQRETEQRLLAAERERDLRAQQSATAERLRLARELHDVLGHNISLINVRTTAALHRSAKRPGETVELVSALELVRDTSKEALRELRATLGVLRQVDEAAPVEPAAGLERLGELVDRASRTGLEISLATTGEPPVLPPNISLAAYRIVQESITNITRHADATRAWVLVDYAPGELRLTVSDDGRGAEPGARGSGIQGMSTRAEALGGELSAGGGPEGGFRVTARLPLLDWAEPDHPAPAAAERGGPAFTDPPAQEG
ncbi:sensor histidine kinase [Streptomyces sp. DSM 44915]|uniref:histidine kinase n=1 Tax=Streptomyces chisholmiae TaxID=3075540 RepID=A0ABU2JZH6_9ACTN|nr:sensor histidine kinase [Streptomyces sp. DSM 44915]MDT0270408.1 sensor histidine kinase [Streptomyces sp. DSM 44915]